MPPLPSLLLLCATLSLAVSAPASSACSPDETTPITPAYYIVTFNSYFPSAHHESTVRAILALTPPTHWRLLSRANPAAALPTDFLLLETAHQCLRSHLEANRHVRAVTLQGHHRRAPKAVRLRLPTHVADSSSSSSSSSSSPTRHAFRAGALWRRGFTGHRVSVAVFDTGLISDQRHFRNVASITDWTTENTTHDHVGHGTFVAGLIAGTHPSCPGLAPDVQLHVFRVFTAAQVSYTSWFLDAFNYALHLGVDVLNLSIGGPDFADNPFTEKVEELSAHGVVVVSAIGNDGPLWGSLNNPGDMMSVVGVGGAEPDGRVASFSSRGMTTHELDHPSPSYGRVKPDIVAYARSLVGPSHRAADRCRRLSGTSVASPVVAGAIALLASAVPLSRRKHVVNPASIKRALAMSARRLRDASVYEQGAGLLDIEDAYEEMVQIDSEFVDAQHASRSQSDSALQMRRSVRTASSETSDDPAGRDAEVFATPAVYQGGLSSTDWHARQNATGRGQAVPGRRLFSMTHGTVPPTMGPTAAFFPSFYDLRPGACPHMWPHCAQPLFKGAMPVTVNVTILNPGGVQGNVSSVVWVPGRNGDHLDVSVSVPERFWPWAAGMGVHLSTQKVPRHTLDVEGVLHVRVVSVHENTQSDIELPIKARIMAPPAREKRLLWDMQHSIRYPPGYVPRDNLVETKDMLDWLGDHPHTNFHALFRELVVGGYHVEILDQPISCFGIERARMYGGMVIVDSEDEFSGKDKKMIEELVKRDGMALVVAAEWYNVDIMKEIRFEDDNTRSWWSPIVAGGNVPALNDLLEGFGIGFGDDVFSGEVRTGLSTFQFESGVSIVRFPAGGELLMASGLRLHSGKGQSSAGGSGSFSAPVGGLSKAGAGSVVVYGDSNCLDTAFSGSKCYSFFVSAISTAIGCVGQRRCEKLARNGQISGSGLDGGESGGGRLAAEMPDEMVEMFRPHSRSGGATESAAASEQSETAAAAAAEMAVCARRGRALAKVEVVHAGGGGGWGPGLQMRRHGRGRPLGAQRPYYGAARTTRSSGAGAEGGEIGGIGGGGRGVWLVGGGVGLVCAWMWRWMWQSGWRRVRGAATSGRRGRGRVRRGGHAGRGSGARTLGASASSPG